MIDTKAAVQKMHSERSF